MIRRKSLKILVADDSSVVRQLLALWLHKVCSCEVDSAIDGLAAAQKIQAAKDSGKPFDLLITDLSMPNMNGIQLVEQVRRTNSRDHLPILVLTTFAATEYREKAARAGATDYLTKPLRYYELYRTIHRLFPNSGEDPAPKPYLRAVMAG